MSFTTSLNVTRSGRAILSAVAPFVAVAATLTASAHASVQVDKTAIKAGTVITLAGEPIKNGIIVIEGGRVTAVGSQADVQIPWDAEVIDQPTMTAFPGFVESHVSRGIDRANETLEIAPFLNVRDSIDPVNFYFEDAIRNGIVVMNIQQGNDTVVAGQGMVVKPHGMTVEAMMVKPRAGIKMSVAPKRGKSRATQAQALRGAFGDLQRYLEDMVQRKKDGDDFDRREALYQGRELEGEAAKGKPLQSTAWKIDGFERIPRGEVDEKQEGLLHVIEGKMPVFMWCGSAADVHTALRISDANGFTGQMTLVLDASCWKAASKIKAAGVSVILDDNLTHRERDPMTGEEIETFVPKVFYDAGVTFALTSSADSNRSLWFQAAQCVAGGIPRDAALAAATTVPAAILGLEDRVGSTKAGADGHVVLFSGDPLSVTSVVEHVILDGKHVYDRSKDVRVQQLTDGTRPPGTVAEEPEDYEGDGEDGDTEGDNSSDQS
ncbi:MAG: imidazolonepropionase-like amidohydrolase [Planctomycetota bacterium]|jgi:imidazolonepropionase-like amidohydrolase